LPAKATKREQIKPKKTRTEKKRKTEKTRKKKGTSAQIGASTIKQKMPSAEPEKKNKKNIALVPKPERYVWVPQEWRTTIDIRGYKRGGDGKQRVIYHGATKIRGNYRQGNSKAKRPVGQNGPPV